jgi:hypothetical protein
MASHVQAIRELWRVTESGGIEAALRRTPPDMEWRPHVAHGQVFRTDELLKSWREFVGEREVLHAQITSTQDNGDTVLISGRFRLTAPDKSLSDYQVHWLFSFHPNGRMRSASSFATLAEAKRAAKQSAASAD